jgi:Ca2+-transporting ATPase
VVTLVRQLRSPLVYILIAAGVVTMALGEFADTAVILTVVLLNTVIGFIQERRADQSIRALLKLLALKARVMRAGREHLIESSGLIPGDIVLLESGSRVPADMRLLHTTALRIDESLLTGESMPVAKEPQPRPPETGVADRTNMAFTGTVVATGRGRGVVVATGGSTALGAIAGSVRRSARTATPLQRRMTSFARLVAAAVVLLGVAAFALGLGMGRDSSEMLRVSVALAVSAVPEGLPVATTVALAIGVRRMAARNAIIRRLSAAETLGSTSVIASDKTGTLTENRMTVQAIWADGEQLRLDSARQQDPGTSLYLTAFCGVVANEASIDEVDGEIVGHGDPTEIALLVAAKRVGVEPDQVRDTWEPEEDLPFESERQYSATLGHVDGRRMLFVKGAPERVLAMSLVPGQVLGDIRDAEEGMVNQGMRVLAFACAEVPENSMADLLRPEGLRLLGLQGMIDPPRHGVREAIAGCHQSGIRVVMVTGDHPGTAAAMAEAVGIAQVGASVVTGSTLSRLSTEELRASARQVSVFARVPPDEKLRLVEALQNDGHVVAVTGDGVNDAPALRRADIGIAMGKSGTDVAREASDMVLADDNFTSIYAAVEQGRVTFENIRKVSFFLISTGVAELILIFAALGLNWPLPLLPAQILWLNLVTNGLQDVALAFEPGDRDIKRRPPKGISEGIMSGLLWERTVLSGIVMAVGTLALFDWARDGSLAEAQTVALTTMVVFQVFQAGNARSETQSVFLRSPVSNPFLFYATAAALTIHIAAIYAPPTQTLLDLEPIDFEAWPRMLLVASTVLAAVELHKLIRRPAHPSYSGIATASGRED